MTQAPKPVDLYVGRKLAELRMANGLSQTDLGSKVNLSFQQVQKYEKGSNRISASRLYDFAAVFGVDVSFFFEGFQGVTNAKLTSSPTLAEFRLAYKIHRIGNIKTRRLVENLVDVLIENHGELGGVDAA